MLSKIQSKERNLNPFSLSRPSSCVDTDLIHPSYFYHCPGEPRGLATRCFWDWPLCRPPGSRAQARLTFKKKFDLKKLALLRHNLHTIKFTHLKWFVLTNAYTHATTIWYNQDWYILTVFLFPVLWVWRTYHHH